MRPFLRITKNGLVTLVALLIFLTTFSPILAAPSKVIYKGNTSEKVIAITIDDGYHSGNYSKLLQVLKRHNIKATFFLNGQAAQNNAQLTRNTATAGHEIANHSYSHPDFRRTSTSEMKNQLARTETIIKNLTGKSTKPYFRAPYGATNSTVLRTVGDAGYTHTFHWSIDTIDWTGNSATDIYNRVMNNLHPGAIVLMHTGAGASGTPGALERMIPAIKARGYRFVTLSQLLNRKPSTPAPTPGTTYTVRRGTHSMPLLEDITQRSVELHPQITLKTFT